MAASIKSLPQVPGSKRAFDVAISIIILVLLSPILLILFVAVWLAHGWPVFFTQLRPGYMTRPFRLVKFRTMKKPSPGQEGVEFDSKRLTKLGQFLRASSLDELPELWNVLRGEMSLVGPRPLLMQYLKRYSHEQSRRHRVLPGITGWAQINGRNAITWERKFELDVWYVDHWSFGLDLKIIWLTFWKVIRREGISEVGEATAKEWMGNK